MITIGILALQGNYNQHKNMLKSLGVNSIFVRYSEELNGCDGFIIPGGESTSMSIQIDRNGIRNSIIKFSQNKSIFGGCAGMIMLSSGMKYSNMKPLSLMDFSIDKNAWGRQVNSFSDKLNLKFDNIKDFKGIFIRAPKLSRLGKNIKVLATYNKEPVMITDGKHYVCSFHPEIGSDNRLHAYFINKIND